MRLRVTYHRPADLIGDHEQQFVRGGLLVKVSPPAELELYSSVELELVSPVGSATIAAQVIQTLPGAAIAVGFAPDLQEIEALVAAARSAPESAGGGAVEHELVEPAPAHSSAPSAGKPAVDVHTRLREASNHEKMQIAMRGGKEERGIIIRDPTARMLHPYVLKNPRLQIDEVATIAALRTVSQEVLKTIAGRREWAQRPEVAAALVRNPKTPVPLAVRLVPFLSNGEIRQLAKSASVRAPILKAVRKKALR